MFQVLPQDTGSVKLRVTTSLGSALAQSHLLLCQALVFVLMQSTEEGRYDRSTQILGDEK